MGTVIIPFDLFVCNEFFKNVITQDFPYQLAFLSFQDGHIEVSGKVCYPMGLPFLGIHLKDILFNRIG